jgi:hypothetical protein
MIVMMWVGACALCGCDAGYEVRPVPRIFADQVGQPIKELIELFGEPRKVDTTATRQLYVWYLPQKPSEGSPSGFNGCEVEVSVDARSSLVLGFSQTNLGYTTCAEVLRKVHVKEES